MVLVCALALSGLVMPAEALARRQQDVRYPFQRVWNAALRMVRVDMRLPITDRDPDAGYMLFEYVDSDRKYPGSIEIISGEQDKRPFVKVVVNVNGMPSYVEQMLIDKLEKKLNAEYGAPLDPPKKEEPKQPKEPVEPKPDEPSDALPMPPAETTTAE